MKLEFTTRCSSDVQVWIGRLADFVFVLCIHCIDRLVQVIGSTQFLSSTFLLSRNFNKMESIDDYQKRKEERIEKLFGSNKKLDRLARPKVSLCFVLFFFFCCSQVAAAAWYPQWNWFFKKNSTYTQPVFLFYWILLYTTGVAVCFVVHVLSFNEIYNFLFSDSFDCETYHQTKARFYVTKAKISPSFQVFN